MASLADVRTEQQIEALLRSLDVETQRSYYAELLPPGICIQYGGKDGKGKRLQAAKAFTEGELIIREAPLVAGQHTANRGDALVCSMCFRFLGSIEAQIAHRLLGDATDTSAAAATLQPTGGGGVDTEAPAPARQHTGSCDHRKAPAAAAQGAVDPAPGAAAGGSVPPGAQYGGREMIAPLEPRLRALADGTERLPHSDSFPLPAPVACRNACPEELYCSAICEQAAWEGHHSLLCTGPGAGSGTAGGASAAAAHAHFSSPDDAMRAFKQHADASNDIFHVAARALAGVCLRARARLDGRMDAGPEARWSALLLAWTPLHAGWKAAWWEAVALPEDVVDEASFRQELRGLASESLALLQAALPAEAAAFPALFSLPVYGAVIGMFELNNLGVVVASPVEDYFLHIDGLQGEERTTAMATVRPLLDALGEEYGASAEGTGLYALQSCANHSCEPNAHALKGDEDVTGDAVISARQSIAAGEEITISYIDEGLPYKERQAALADYGFECRCRLCLQESNAETAEQSSEEMRHRRKRPAEGDADREC